MENDKKEKKLVKAYFSAASLSFGFVASTLAEFKERVSAVTGVPSEDYCMREEGSSIIEDDDEEYFSTLSNGVTIYISKKDAEAIYVKPGNNNANSAPVVQKQDTAGEIKQFESALSDFDRSSMEFMRKLALKDPSLLPLESVPLFWRYCADIGDKDLANFARNLFYKNPMGVITTEGCKEFCFDQWDEIVDSETIQCTEFELVSSINKWARQNSVPSDHPRYKQILSRIRFGTFSLENLVNEINSLLLPEDIIYPFLRYHFCPKEKSASFVQQYPKTFEMREYQKENYAPMQLVSKEAQFITPAKGKPWSLLMSSQYGGLPNNYESLVSGKWNHPGCATNYGPCAQYSTDHQFIQAAFDSQVHVTKIIVSSPTLGVFASQGWGNGYIGQLSISYSKDDESAFEVVKKLAGISEREGPIEIDLTEFNLIGKRFRLTSVGYVATGSFILE